MKTIIEIKDILEKINSRISEAKKKPDKWTGRQNGLKQKTTYTEQNRENRKEMRTVLETSETY